MMKHQIGYPCKACADNRHERCAAECMVDTKFHPLSIPGFTLKEAEKHCYCLYTNHKHLDRVKKADKRK